MQYWNGLIHAKNLITSGWINDTDNQHEYQERVIDIIFPELWGIGGHILNFTRDSHMCLVLPHMLYIWWQF